MNCKCDVINVRVYSLAASLPLPHFHTFYRLKIVCKEIFIELTKAQTWSYTAPSRSLIQWVALFATFVLNGGSFLAGTVIKLIFLHQSPFLAQLPMLAIIHSPRRGFTYFKGRVCISCVWLAGCQQTITLTLTIRQTTRHFCNWELTMKWKIALPPKSRTTVRIWCSRREVMGNVCWNGVLPVP